LHHQIRVAIAFCVFVVGSAVLLLHWADHTRDTATTSAAINGFERPSVATNASWASRESSDTEEDEDGQCSINSRLLDCLPKKDAMKTFSIYLRRLDRQLQKQVDTDYARAAREEMIAVLRETFRGMLIKVKLGGEKNGCLDMTRTRSVGRLMGRLARDYAGARAKKRKDEIADACQHLCVVDMRDNVEDWMVQEICLAYCVVQ